MNQGLFNGLRCGLEQGAFEGQDIGLHKGLFSDNVSIYCAEYSQVINRAVNLGYKLPSIPVRFLQNRLVRKLIVAGIWKKLDLFYLFRNDAGLQFSTLNFKNPLKFQGNP